MKEVRMQKFKKCPKLKITFCLHSVALMKRTQSASCVEQRAVTHKVRTLYLSLRLVYLIVLVGSNLCSRRQDPLHQKDVQNIYK